MPQPTECPPWEYNTTPGHNDALHRRTAGFLTLLRAGRVDHAAVSTESRRVHGALFLGLTPRQVPYYAGHYRGENLLCLVDYVVQIESDPRVGFDPKHVYSSVRALGRELEAGLAALDDAHRLPTVECPAREKLYFTVVLAAYALELFYRIHPYANGNGHIGRMIVWVILGRYGYWPQRWPIHPRPDPPFIECIREHRSGNQAVLEKYILENIIHAEA